MGPISQSAKTQAISVCSKLNQMGFLNQHPTKAAPTHVRKIQLHSTTTHPNSLARDLESPDDTFISEAAARDFGQRQAIVWNLGFGETEARP
jgi:hypothetical protein